MKTITAEEFDKKFDDGEDVSEYIDFSQSYKLGDEPRRVGRHAHRRAGGEVMRRAVVALAVGAAAAVGAGSARAESPLEIHTAIDDVRACAVTREGVVLAGTAGGLAVYGADGKLGGEGEDADVLGWK